MGSNRGKICKTNELCEISGYWVPIVSKANRSFLIKKGETFPKFDDLRVDWSLESEGIDSNDESGS